jgi:hypothetical protein
MSTPQTPAPPQTFLGWLAWPFWCAPQQRPRALWRLALAIAWYWPVPGLLGKLAYGLGLPYVWYSWQLADALAMALLLLLAGLLWDRRAFRDYGFRRGKAWFADLGFGLALGAALHAAHLWPRLGGGLGAGHGRLPERQRCPLLARPALAAVHLSRRGLHRGIPGARLSCATWPRAALAIRLAGRRPRSGLVPVVGLFRLDALDQSQRQPGQYHRHTLGGLFLGLGYLLTAAWHCPSRLHITWNLFEGTVLGFPSAASILARRASWSPR